MVYVRIVHCKLFRTLRSLRKTSDILCFRYQTPTRTLTTGQYIYGGLNEVDIDADSGMTFCIIAIRVTVTYQRTTKITVQLEYFNLFYCF